ncbi:acetyltransferase [Carpediemonas membranifera]|uniref:Acetyltransferase n=1 Tax=Carpediemonas membranifera TaxID=201153 RepID=A0A8J6E774_9EUKA|nr:acetyltransferase [Carpediemonas membranifera]|eukprot:KAG9390385.1 acetyltransferase [Carpediemonas membranifera]
MTQNENAEPTPQETEAKSENHAMNDHSKIDLRVVPCVGRNLRNQLADLMVTAFVDDPNAIWHHKSYKSAEHKFRRLLHDLFIAEILSAKAHGLVQCTMQGDTVVGGIIAVPSAHIKKFDTMVTLRYAKRVLGHLPTVSTMVNLALTDMWDARHRSKIMKGRPFIYLFAIGVNLRGQGVGGVQMRQLTAIADILGLPIYLENSKDKNLPFYGRFGFEVQEKAVVREKKDGPVLWLMVREPQKAGPAPPANAV